MRYACAALLAVSLLIDVGDAKAGSPKESVMMQIRGNVVASTEVCELLSFVAATPPSQPEVGATVCAIGGPFGAGTVGTVVDQLTITGNNWHLDEIITFGPTDLIYMSTVMQQVDQLDTGAGGLRYFSGTWTITRGTGAFAGLTGQGTLVNAIVSNVSVPPPPQYGVGQYFGWVTR